MTIALTPIVEQLRHAGCREVAGLLEYSRLTTPPRALPAHFVVPTTESARPNSLSGGRDQAVDTGFSVIVVLDGARRDQAGVSEELRTVTGAVVDAIAGWTHPEASRACDYAGGRLLSADGSTVAWAVSFTTRHHLRKTS